MLCTEQDTGLIRLYHNSPCRFVEFNTSIICRLLVNYFGSYLLQDMFLNLQVFAFEGQNMTYTVNVLLTCILNCDAGPGCV